MPTNVIKHIAVNGTAYDLQDDTKVSLSQGTSNEGNILRVDSTGILALDKTMIILSYGKSTWNDFIVAYKTQSVVYCRASSGSNPASGSQTRMAFLAYVNDETSPTEVEFQYYRSVSSHSDSQQGDQVFVYKLTSTGAWTVTTRNAFSKVVAGTNMSSSYNSGVITLSSNAAASLSVSVTATTEWTGSDAPYTQNITVTGVTASNNIIVGLSATATSAQYDAAVAGKILCTAQSANSITLTAYGTKPTVAIPFTVIIVG